MIKAVGFDEKKAALLFKIIPFLLHANAPDLPGYVDDPACPFGIFGLKPLQLVDAELFNRYFPSSQALRQDTPSIFSENPVIHSLKTIGSIGTIAQADRSDCDFWLSIRQSEIGSQGLALLVGPGQRARMHGGQDEFLNRLGVAGVQVQLAAGEGLGRL